MVITIRQVDNDAEAMRIEADLKAKGYRFVNKTNEKTLQPKEYIKRSWTGTANSFEGGARHWVITYCSPD